MRDLRRFFACALGACLCASPAIVLAQHGAEAKPAEHAAPAAKHEPAAETKAAGHAVKAEPKAEAPKAAEAKPKDTAKTAKPEPNAKAEPKAEPAKKGETAATHEPEGKAPAKAAKADGPRVTVTRVDETTGAARGAAKPVANSKLEAALGRISERIDDGRKEPARAASAKSANRIRLSWRTTLDWPEELGAAAPEPQLAAPPAEHEAAPDKDHVALVWE